MASSALNRLANMRKPGRWFLDALDSAEESTGGGRHDPGWFHPSSFGHQCDAFLAFRFLGVQGKETITARQRRIFDLGHARDEQLKRDAKNSGASIIQKEEERKILIPQYYIRGEIDDLVQNPVTGRKYIVDYKTMNPDSWGKLEVIVPSHHKQIHPYMYAKEVYEGLVLYENKGNQEHKIMEGNFMNEVWGEITGRIERVISGILGGFVNRNPIPNETSCPFYYMCSWANVPQLLEEARAKGLKI